MKYRTFGKTGFQVSALGFGAMRLPGKPFLPGSVDTRKAIHLIRYAIDSGINYIDTAYIYHLGASEKTLGLALKDGYRDKVHLVTKLPMILTKKTEDFDRFLNEQLERLQTDHVDTYLFHAVNEKAFGQIVSLSLLEKMEAARAEGKIRYIGFSFHDSLPVFKKVIDYYPWDVTQIQYNYLDANTQATTRGLEYAHSKGMGVVIMEPLKGGTLVKPPAEVLVKMRKAHATRTPIDWAFKFLWNRKEVSLVLSGMGSERMVRENCSYADASDIDALSEDDNKALGEIINIFESSIQVPCTACAYCMPCPFGVNIPENFALINHKGLMPRNLADIYFHRAIYHSNRKRLLKKGGAFLCKECGLCVPKCPQGINIPVELKKSR